LHSSRLHADESRSGFLSRRPGIRQLAGLVAEIWEGDAERKSLEKVAPPLFPRCAMTTNGAVSPFRRSAPCRPHKQLSEEAHRLGT
jgi:hypothetical protein